MSAGTLSFSLFLIVSCLNIDGCCLFYILEPFHAAAPLSIFTAVSAEGIEEGKRVRFKIEEYCLGRCWAAAGPAGRFRLRLIENKLSAASPQGEHQPRKHALI